MRLIPFLKKTTSASTRGQAGTSSGDKTSNASSSRRQDVADVLDATILIIQQVTQLVPLDTAKNILAGITSILLLLQKNIKNRDDLTALAQTCEAICLTLRQATYDVSVDEMSDALRDSLETFKSSIDQLYSKVNLALQHGRIRRVIGATFDEKQISGWTGELTRVLTLFSTRVNIVAGIRSEQTYYLLKHPELPGLRPELPPAPPAMFFGRDRLFAQVKEALFRDEDVTLIGPGGIGKSTIAKALLNDADIQKRYSRRFFVTYDGIDPTTITSGSFIDRIASALGLRMLGDETKHQVISNLALSPVLIVLDNAETFEDAADRDVVAQIASIVSEIANTRGAAVLLTSRTCCNARQASWAQIDVPPLEKVPARQYFRKIYQRVIADDDIDDILGALDFHPLSIHILAYTARECRWTGEELLDEWNTQQSRLLQTGDKKENLAFTIRLSLSSPSVKDLGEDALNVLHIIAFLPQGINRKYVTHMFPSIPQISPLVNTLCKLSLVYRSGPFFTTLAPIRLFILDTFPAAGLELLENVRHMYYDSIQEISTEKDSHSNLFISDHLNIEHLIFYDIAHSPENISDNTLPCNLFLSALEYHKARPTSLVPLIPSLPQDSHDEKESKAQCLYALGRLYFALSNYVPAMTTSLSASTLFAAVANHSMAALSTSVVAMSYNHWGYFAKSQQLLEEFIHSPSWQYIDEDDQAEIHFTLDWSKMRTSRESADKLFLHSMDHPYRGPQSRVTHCRAKMFYGYTTPEQVEKEIEPIRSQSMSSESSAWVRWTFLGAAADAAFLQQKFDVAMELLGQAREAVSDDFLLTLIILYLQAAVASAQGNYEFARSFLQHTLDTLTVVATPSSTDFLEMRYVHARNELYAKDYPEARRLLVNIVTDCEVHNNIITKVKCTRALGEVAIFLDCQTDSVRYFAQTVQLCKEAGVPPELLGVCEPMTRLDDDRFSGWKRFLQGRVG